jgi:hypothetical protein
VLHSGRLWPYLQTSDKAGEACQGQTLKLITKIRKLRTKKLAPGVIFESGVSSNPPIDSGGLSLFNLFNLVSLTHKHLTSLKILALNKQSHLFASKLAPKKKMFLKIST